MIVSNPRCGRAVMKCPAITVFSGAPGRGQAWARTERCSQPAGDRLPPLHQHAEPRRTTEIMLHKTLAGNARALLTPRLLPRRAATGCHAAARAALHTAHYVFTAEPCTASTPAASLARRERQAAPHPATMSSSAGHEVNPQHADGCTRRRCVCVCPRRRKEVFRHRHGADFCPVIYKTV